MADNPQFQQLFESKLFVLDASSGAPGWVAFIYCGAEPIPTEMTLANSFNAGHYLFSAVGPTLADTAAADAYAARIQAWLNSEFGGNNNRFAGSAALWLLKGEGPEFGVPTHTALTFIEQQFSTNTSDNFNCPVGQLTLSVPKGVAISMGENGLRLRNQSNGQIDFNTQVGNNAPDILGNVYVPFEGQYAGCFLNQGTISRSGGPGTLAYFETGFQFSYLDAETNTVQRQAYPAIVTGDALPPLPYAGAYDPLDFYNAVVPLSDPIKGKYRTLFGLTSAEPLKSWYRDSRGLPLDLVPLANISSDNEPSPYSAALVLQVRSDSFEEEKVVVSMTLAGDYSLVGDAPGEDILVLPGLFGSENLRIRGYNNGASFDHIRFQPSMRAYAPIFPFPESSLEDPSASVPKNLLNTDLCTAWGAVMNGASGHASYLAQPQGNPLYAPLKGAAQTTDGTILPPLPTPSAITQLPTDQQQLLIPILPYAGLSDTKESFPIEMLGAFESQILSAERKRLLSYHSTAKLSSQRKARRDLTLTVNSDNVHQATTPQGLYAEVEVADAASGGEAMYDKIVLAKSTPKQTSGTPGQDVEFSFEFLEAPLQDLFQTNQLMAVVVNPGSLGTPVPSKDPKPPAGNPVFNRDVVIADWRMTAAVGASPNATSFNNILIMKYCDGTLVDRIKNPSKWVGTKDFSLATGASTNSQIALAGVSSYLQSYVQAGIDQADQGNTLYKNFAKIAQDPNWQGFIVLRATVDPSGFPDQIKGLTAGIDFSRFEAHHFGATASRVTVDGETVTMQTPSSLFGLVDYQLPTYQQNVAQGGSPEMPIPVPVQGEYNFTVLQLQALFENAALVDFRSRIQLTMDQMFLSPVANAYSGSTKLPTSAVVLRGSYQRQGETAVYVFEQNNTTVFETASNALQAVPIQRVVFNTVSSGADGTIRSRFLMWGTFEFTTMGVMNDGERAADADLLSFGLNEGEPVTSPPNGLSFSGLEMSLSSPVDAPNAVTYVFDTGKLALDGGSSKARDNSLFSDLALEIDGFIIGAEDKRPVDFGYLPVSVTPKVKAISGPWYGVTYKVNMGSPGALVAGAGFTSRILLAWSPQTGPSARDTAVYTGLQLPGASPGAKLFSIQGVLKLAIGSLLLRREAVIPTQKPAFVLRLNNIALSFLGILKLPKDPINFFLFGDPSGNGSLGWYAAYVQQDRNKQKALEDALDGPGYRKVSDSTEGKK